MGSSVGERACAGAREKSAGQAQAGASGPPPRTAHPGSMPSLVAQAKRALVAALKSVARTYGVRMLRARMGSSVGERACAGAREKSALPVLEIARFVRAAGESAAGGERWTPDETPSPP